MKEIDDITKQLAEKFSGLQIEDPNKPKPKPVEQSRRDEDGIPSLHDALDRRYTRHYGSSSSSSSSSMGGPRIWPSEKFDLRDHRNGKKPTRKPVTIDMIDKADLEECFKTPCRRGWEFPDWLEVIGLPPDLHEEHDGVLYRYAARAYLDRKSEAHRAR